MGKTESMIKLEYTDAINQAKKLRAIVADLKKLADEYEESLHQLSSGWKGENSRNFQKKASRLLNQINDISKAIDMSAGNVETIAINTYNADMEAARIANSRSYGGGGAGSFGGGAGGGGIGSR